jgi:hypothetical protein
MSRLVAVATVTTVDRGRPPVERGLAAVGRLVAAAVLGALVAGVAVTGPAGGAPLPPAPASAGALTVTPLWARLLGPGTAIVESSPVAAALDGSGPSVVVGSRMDGCLYALQLATGATTPGWGHVCPGDGIDSTPAVVPTAFGDEVAVTYGQVAGVDPPAANAGTGGIELVAPTGQVLWSRTLPDVFGSYGPAPPVVASPAVGDIGTGQPSIVVGDVGLSLYALDAATGATEPGWPQRTADTTFATAALAGIDGSPAIIAASDSTAGPGALDDWNGGAVRRMTGGGQTLWTDASNEVVTSGAVVGDLSGSTPSAVFGHGDHFGGSDEDAVTAVDAATGSLQWETHLGGYTLAAPALADLTGTSGQLDVVEPTWRAVGQPVGGTVTALGPTGSELWRFTPPEATTITGSVVTADFGTGGQDVVVATGTGWYLLDGATGQLAAPPQGIALAGFAGDPNVGNLDMENSPLVVPDPSGDGLDVVVAGTYFAGAADDTQGFVAAYRVTGPGPETTAGSWPQYRGNGQLTGSTVPLPPPPGACPAGSSACASQGYLLAGSDGGLFAFGAAGYQGSLPGGGVAVDDVVGMAPTADGLGYWLVASDGGVFAFGDAAFHGSMGGQPLASPVVGMAADPATGGYWLVASDGGVFAFDAPFEGSTGGIVLDRPVVGMAATADGRGYWLVASDGGVFAFGDAYFRGSTGGIALDRPIVAMAATG